MKIRKDFVTNSSSSNFVVAAVDMVPTVIVTYGTVSSILSRYDSKDDDLPEYIVQIDADNLVFGTLDDVGRVEIEIHKVTSAGSTQSASGVIRLSSNCPELVFEAQGNGHHVTDLKFRQVPTLEEITLDLEIHTPVQVEKETLHLSFQASIQFKSQNDKKALNCDEKDSITVEAYFNGADQDETVVERANKTIEVGLHPDTELGKEALYFTQMETNAEGFWGEIRAAAIKDLPKDTDVVPITLVATGELNGELYSEEFVVQLNAMMELKLSKEMIYVLDKGEEPAKLNVQVVGQEEEWTFKLIQEEQVMVSVEEDRIEPNEVDLYLRANDITFDEGDVEVHAECAVRAILGEIELEVPLEIAVVREGVFLEETKNELEVLSGKEEESYRDTLVNFSVAYYDLDKNEIDFDAKFDELVLLEVTSENEDVSKLHKAFPIELEFKEKKSGYHTEGMYALHSKHPWIHRTLESLNGTIVVGLEEDPDKYRLEIPTRFTAQLEKPKKDWAFEVEACRKIITKYLPNEIKDKRLEELETMKDKMGAEEIYALRHEIWQQVLNIMEKEVDDALDAAYWYDWGLYAADWVKWLCDQAFAAAANTVLSPVAGFALVNFKEMTIEYLIDLYYTNLSFEDFTYDFVVKKCWVVADKGGEEIIKKLANESPNNPKIIAGFFLYKVGTHYLQDKDASGKPKGLYEAIKAAALDLTGVVLGDYLAEFEKIEKLTTLGKGGAFLKRIDIFKGIK